MARALEWFEVLAAIAPGIDRTLLRLIADLLGDGRADALWMVDLVLRETAVHLERRVMFAAEMISLARIVRAEAHRRGGGVPDREAR
jgi:hypothetical protein